METYHLPSLNSQRPKYPESKTKITFYPNSTLSDRPSHAAILPGEETSPVTLRSTACFLLSISRQHGLTIASPACALHADRSFLLPTVVPLIPSHSSPS